MITIQTTTQKIVTVGGVLANGVIAISPHLPFEYDEGLVRTRVSKTTLLIHIENGIITDGTGTPATVSVEPTSGAGNDVANNYYDAVWSINGSAPYSQLWSMSALPAIIELLDIPLISTPSLPLLTVGTSGAVVMNWRGAYNAATAYGIDETIGSGGRSFISLQAANTNHTPPTTGAGDAWWGLVADKGATGAAGAAGTPGATGTTGPAGTAGTPGAAGAAGTQGIQGIQGNTGAAGTAGVDGKTILNGVGVPAAGTGANGDFYLDTATDNIYGPKTAGAWGAGVSLIGAAGVPGAAGAAGIQGNTGPAGSAGATGPQGIQGVAGGSMNWLGAWSNVTAYAKDDAVSLAGRSFISLQAANTNHTPPATGSGDTWWSLTADKGATGAQGLTGNTGPAGPAGAAGIQGNTGPAGSAGATAAQASAIAANTAKVSADGFISTHSNVTIAGLVDGQALIFDAVSQNWKNQTLPVGATAAQAADILTNNAKVSDINHVAALLPNVDNTADTAKPVSTAQLTALNLKAALAAAQSFTAAQRVAPVTLTDAITVAMDISLSNFYSLTLAGNRTLGLPTNLVAGQTGSIRIAQDITGSRTLAFNGVWKFAGGTAPTLTTTASAIDRLDYYVVSATEIHAALAADNK